MAASLAQHSSQQRPTLLHAFHLGEIGDDFAERLSTLHSARFSSVLSKMENPFGPDLPIAYGNPSYYLRLMLGDVLDLERVLYLDVDIIVRRNLDALFDIDLKGKTVAAVADPALNKIMNAPPVSQTLFLSSVVIRTYIETIIQPSHIYFNSGVLLIDLGRWRAEAVRQRALAYLSDRYHVLFADQDAINHVLQGDVLYLDRRWNHMPALQDEPLSDDIGILHFAGFKPFSHKDAPQDSDKIYWDYALSTPFGRGLRHKFYMNYYRELRELRIRGRKVPGRFSLAALASQLFGYVTTRR